MIRHPAVAGLFYDQNPEDLRETLDACFLGPYGPGRLPSPAPFTTRNITGLICPHAGLRFSGYAAACAYMELAEDGLPDTVVLIGPNHRGQGKPAAIMSSGSWLMPFGEVNIDPDVAGSILENTDLVQEDGYAHLSEHSLEVQILFLHYLKNKIKIVPIILSIVAWEDVILYAEELSRAVSAALKGKNGVVIASTDMTHYEPKYEAVRKDSKAITAIEALDEAKLLNTVYDMNITMCGVAATVVTISTAKALGATRGKLLSYYTSGDIIGDESQVVGYCSLKLTRVA